MSVADVEIVAVPYELERVLAAPFAKLGRARKPQRVAWLLIMFGIMRTRRSLVALAAVCGTMLLAAVDADPSREYALLAEAGMDYREILAALTTAPAERFDNGNEPGRIAVGYTANLVVLGGDPVEDIQALADVRYTLRAGRLIYLAERSFARNSE